MGEVKHLCLVKFKEGVVVEDVLKGMTDLVAQMDMVKSFECYSASTHIHIDVQLVAEDDMSDLPFVFPSLKLSVYSTFRGQDVLNQEMLTQGFTHVFSLTFASADDLTSYMGHEKHSEVAATFMAALEKVVVIDFPVVITKPPPSA
ncbi:uncharacterized protein C2845_PM05G05530 [Panicum miliaceum]|uniref:Stress-response A/B barrel domain-containing protein n=1 Tax=Panicum miliaceum TaxID=4540 RepID=A0A3L6SWU8_PANMI|nr:uncharacterized protein C2845_PM05G05530 [Panicum miliaceum]